MHLALEILGVVLVLGQRPQAVRCESVRDRVPVGDAGGVRPDRPAVDLGLVQPDRDGQVVAEGLADAPGLETAAEARDLSVLHRVAVLVDDRLGVLGIVNAAFATPHELMGRASAAVETVMGAPQAISLAVGAILVTLLDYHVVFAIMAAFTGAGVVYLLVFLRGRLFRPDPPLMSPLAEPDPVLLEVRVSAEG